MFLLLFHTTLCTNTVCIWVEDRRGKIIGHRRITQIIRNLQIRIRKECIHHQNATDTSVCFEYTKKTQEKPLLARKQRKHPLVSMYSRWFLSIALHPSYSYQRQSNREEYKGSKLYTRESSFGCVQTGSPH